MEHVSIGGILHLHLVHLSRAFSDSPRFSDSSPNLQTAASPESLVCDFRLDMASREEAASIERKTHII